MFGKKKKDGDKKSEKKKTSLMGLEPTIFGSLTQTSPPEADALSIRPQGHTTKCRW